MLTPERVRELIQQADGLAPKEGSIFVALARLVEEEVRKTYDAEITALKSDLSDYMSAANAEAKLATELLEKGRQDKQLLADVLSAMEYHVEQTRPIQSTTTALSAVRERLRECGGEARAT